MLLGGLGSYAGSNVKEEVRLESSTSSQTAASVTASC